MSCAEPQPPLTHDDLRAKLARVTSRKCAQRTGQRGARRRVPRAKHNAITDAALNDISIVSGDDGTFIMSRPGRADVTITERESESRAVRALMDGLSRESASLMEYFRTSSHASAQHGALYINLTGFHDLMHATNIACRFEPQEVLEAVIPDARVPKILSATKGSCHVPIIVNMRLHEDHMELDDNDRQIRPSDFGVFLLNSATHCNNDACNNDAQQNSPHKKVTTKEGFIYCSQTCKKQDTSSRKRIGKCIHTMLGVRKRSK